MDYQNIPNLLSLFLGSAERLSDRPFLWTKQDGAYAARSWRQIRDEIARLHRGLEALGIGPGDRVALVADNRPKWLIADHAIMACGAITVPAYTTNTVEDHLHILNNSGAKAVFGSYFSTNPISKQLAISY